MPNKILIVGTQGQEVTSGPGTFMRYLCEAIDSGKLNADVLYPHSPRGTAFADKPFVKFAWGAAPFYNRFFGSWIIVAFFVWVHLIRSKQHRNYSKIWFADRYSALFCILFPQLRTRCVVMVNDDTRILRYNELSQAKNGLKTSLMQSLSIRLFYHAESFICRRTSLVISNSKYLSEILVRSYGLPDERVKLLYKAVDLNRFPARREGPTFQEPIKVLFIKNEWGRGGLDVLLGALAKISGCSYTLTVVGIRGDPAQQEIKKIAQDKGYAGGLVFKGLVDRDKISKLYRDADIFCVPSRREALGVSFMEALSSGTPVVATNVGGIPEVLDGGKAGWMINPCAEYELAEALKDCISNPVKRREKTAHGLQYIQTFSSDCMIAQLANPEIDIQNGQSK